MVHNSVVGYFVGKLMTFQVLEENGFLSYWAIFVGKLITFQV